MFTVRCDTTRRRGGAGGGAAGGGAGGGSTSQHASHERSRRHGDAFESRAASAGVEPERAV